MGKFLKRALFGILGVVVVLALFLAASIGVDALGSTARLAPLVNTTIPASLSVPEIRAYVARPKTPGPHPAVIMVHEFWGLKPDIIGKADALAEQGYLVIAPDAFRGRTTDWIPSAIFNVVVNTAEQVDGDMAVVFDWLATQPDVDQSRIGIMGFCFGGRTAINHAVSNQRVAVTAVFYGNPVTDTAKLRGLGPVLGVFGGADNSIPVAGVKEFETGLKAAGVKNEIKIYDGQPHAFVTDMQAIRAGGAQGEAWDQLLAFLEANLKNGGRSAVPANVASIDSGVGYVWRLAFEHLAGGHTH